MEINLSCHIQGWLHGEFPYILLFVYMSHRKEYVEISFKNINILQFVFMYDCIVPEDSIWTECILKAQQYNFHYYTDPLPALLYFFYIWLCITHHSVDNYHLIISVPEDGARKIKPRGYEVNPDNFIPLNHSEI